MARDRLSNLGDDLLCLHILTKLPLKDAIRCSSLSRRWAFLWRQLPNIRFSQQFFGSLPPRCSKSKNQTEGIIDNILRMHSGPLEVFELYNYGSCKSHKVCSWTLLASVKGVKEITFHANQEVPSSLFQCQTFTKLTLRNMKFINIPTSFGGFASLATCHLKEVELDEKFELMISSCQVLQDLEVFRCTGLGNLKICSLSLKSLSLCDLTLDPPKSITVNCPHLAEIKIKDCNFPNKEIIIPECVSLVTTDPIEQFTTARLLKKITLSGATSAINLLSEFPALEQLCVEDQCLTLQDATSETLEIRHLEKVHIDIRSENTTLLSLLLKNAPSLKTVIVSVRNYMNVGFVNKLWSLKILHADKRILLIERKRKNTCFSVCELLSNWY